MSKGSSYWSTARGKIGNTVVSINKGQRIERAYQPVVNNPRTNKQTLQRALFSSQVKFYKAAMANFFKFAFEDKKQTESDYNAFMRNNRGVGIVLNRATYLNKFFPALGNNWMLTKGSLMEFNIRAVEGEDFPGVIEVNDIDTKVTNATIGQVSQSLITTYDLQAGDIITIVTINTKVDDITDEPTTAPAWSVKQFILDTADTRTFTEAGFSGNVTMEKQTSTESAYISMISEATGDNYGIAVMASRVTTNGIKVNNSYVYLSAVLLGIYNQSLQDDYRAQALTSWGATGEAILEGTLVQ